MENSVIHVETSVASCKGGDAPDNHPHVYLDLDKKGEITCPYCSRHFVLKQKTLTLKEF